MNPAKSLQSRIDRLTALLAADETYTKERVEAYRRNAHASAEKRSQEFATAFAEKRAARVKRLTAEGERLTAALTALGETAEVSEKVEA